MTDPLSTTTAAPGAGIEVRDLTARHRHGPDVVHGVSLCAPRGAVTAIIGPNGAG